MATSAPEMQAIDYRECKYSGGDHTCCTSLVRPSKSEFISDVELAAKRCLSPGEHAYFKLYYKCNKSTAPSQQPEVRAGWVDYVPNAPYTVVGLNERRYEPVVAVEPGETEQLQAHIDSFPESKRAAVASLDLKVRAKLGAHLIEVGLSPTSAYMAVEDVRGRKRKSKRQVIVFTIMACADDVPAKFLTPAEASQYLGGLNARTVVRWAREGYLPSIPIGEGKRRLWRFVQRDLEEWMLARRQGGQNAA